MCVGAGARNLVGIRLQIFGACARKFETPAPHATTMSYRLMLLGGSQQSDVLYRDNYSPVTYKEGTTVRLDSLGQCMIVRACSDPAVFEKEFLQGTGLSSSDFDMHYIYSTEYLYVPKDQEAFDGALPLVVQNARASKWCINALFHIRTN